MKTTATIAIFLTTFAASQTTNTLTFAPTEESKTRPECVPTQCINLPATITATEIEQCLQSAASGCQYTGNLTSTGTSTDICQQSGTSATYVSVALPTSDLSALSLQFGPMTGVLTLNADAPATAQCPFYAFQDSRSGCEATSTVTPLLGNTAISTMNPQAQAFTVEMANLTSAPAYGRLGFTVALPAAQCGENFSSVVFDSFTAPFTVTIPEATTSEIPVESETYSKFVQAVGSAASCYTPQCAFTIVPLTREQVDACVSSVPADCVFEGVSHLVTDNADLPCDGNLSIANEQNIVLDEASYRRLGRATGPMSGSLTLSMKTSAATDCPITSFKVETFNPSQNCGIQEPITASTTPIATLLANSNSVAIDAANAFTDGSLGLKISGPSASCGTASKSLATDVSAPFVYSREVDGASTSSAGANLMIGGLALVTLLVTA